MGGYHLNEVEWIGPALATAVVFFAPVAIILIVLRHRRAIAELKNRTLLAIIERGETVPPELLLERKATGDEELKRGVLFLFLGLGVIAFVLSLPDRRLWGLGLIPLSAGLGYLLTWVLLRVRRPRGDG